MTELTLNPKKEIKNPKFSDGDGFALCHKLQGHGANGWEDIPLMMKSINSLNKDQKDLLKSAMEVQVNLSMEDFLKKFFQMYTEDAKVLAGILGYEMSTDTTSSYEDYLEDKVEAVTLLKSLDTKEFSDLPFEDQIKCIDLQKQFEKGLLSEIVSEGAIQEMLSKENNSNNNVTANSENGEEENMSELQDQIDSLSEKLNKALEVNKEQEEMIKTFKKEQEDKEKESALVKSKDISFIDEGKDEFISMLKGLEVDSISSVMSMLVKAQTKISELEGKLKDLEESDPMFKSLSQGEDEEQTAMDVKSMVKAKIKARNSK